MSDYNEVDIAAIQARSHDYQAAVRDAMIAAETPRGTGNDSTARRMTTTAFDSAKDVPVLVEEVQRWREFADWLLAMDEPGSEDCRTVTLSRIIERVKTVRGGEL